MNKIISSDDSIWTRHVLALSTDRDFRIPDYLSERLPSLNTLHDLASSAEWVEVDFPVTNTFVLSLNTVLPKNSYLHTLQLSQGGLSADLVSSLIDAMSTQGQIDFFEINNNPRINHALFLSCPCLKALGLSRNSIDDNGAEAIARAMAVNTNLESLFLRENSIGDAGCQALSAGLDENEHITSLDLAENKITDVGARALQVVYKKRMCATKLNLEENSISRFVLAELGRGYVQPTIYQREKSKDFVD